jgi:uncharacterized RDD family membrane protein YckC
VAFIADTELDPVTGELEEDVFDGGFGPFNGVSLGFSGLSLAASLLYYGLLNGGDRGQTVGKRVLSIQVRDATSGGPIGVGRGVLRALVAWGPGQAFTFAFVGGIWTVLDGLWPLWDERRQALHDKVANSVVVDVV